MEAWSSNRAGRSMNPAKSMLCHVHRLMNASETLDTATALLNAVLTLPPALVEPDQLRDAHSLINWIASGRALECIERRQKHDALISEIMPLLKELEGNKQERRRQRRKWRDELADNVYSDVKKGVGEREMRSRYGISGFTLQRAYNQIKRMMGDPAMSNWQMRRYIRAS